jgi:DNA-binding NtrC family response regulator
VDCTTLRETLLESQLFGHVKGAFTGADTATIGFFRAADGGTLFLDEIGEMDLPAQAKLLRCIQDRAVVPLGGVEPIPVDVRIIAATHRDLKAMVSRGAFRQDLYYRLNVVRLTVPALRERPTDIGQLAEHFLVTYARLEDEAPKRIAPAAIRALEQHDWKGNVRELANVIEQAHVLSSGREIAVDDLPEEIRLAAAAPIAGESDEVLPLATVERMLVARALRVANGNQSQAARMLEIDRRRLYRKVRQHKLQSLVNPRRGAGDAGCR